VKLKEILKLNENFGTKENNSEEAVEAWVVAICKNWSKFNPSQLAEHSTKREGETSIYSLTLRNCYY